MWIFYILTIRITILNYIYSVKVLPIRDINRHMYCIVLLSQCHQRRVYDHSATAVTVMLNQNILLDN